MLQISKTQWISTNHILFAVVFRSELRLFLDTEDTYFAVEESYLPAVCSALGIKYESVLGLCYEQEKELADGRNQG